ncbi:MAG: hypothetical protein AB7G80_03290 [Dongiaceae bacterium]
MGYKILFSNIGYAKGIGGTLWEHICRLNRHIYCGLSVQEQALRQLKVIIDSEKPDLGCLVEIDQGSFHSAYFNQIQALMDHEYIFHDIAEKYGENSPLRKMWMHKGKSNAFLAKQEIPFQRLYFTYGTKRLVYRLTLPGDIHLFFAHFSLKRQVRIKQFQEVNTLIKNIKGEVMILADFNIFQGFKELLPLLEGTDLQILNKEEEHTFIFHRRKLALDLCICSESLAKRSALRIIKQPFSDHAALVVDIAPALSA